MYNFNDRNRWLHSILQRVEFRRSTQNPVTDVACVQSPGRASAEQTVGAKRRVALAPPGACSQAMTDVS